MNEPELVASMPAEADYTDLDNNMVHVRFAKKGSRAYHKDGVVLTWPQATLEAAAPTYVGGKVSINHKVWGFGSIEKSWVEGDVGHQMVHINDELKGMIVAARNAGVPVGVSTEANPVVYDPVKLEITAATGYGIAFVFPPSTPWCPPEEGCGIVAAKDAPPADKYQVDEPATETVAEVPAVAPAVEAALPQGENMTDTNAPPAENPMALELEAAKSELTELRAFKEAKVAEEKNSLLAVIASYIDAAAFKDANLCTLRATKEALESYKAKIAVAEPVNSGIQLKAAEEKAKPELPVIEGASPEEVAAAIEAAKRAEKHNYNVKVN